MAHSDLSPSKQSGAQSVPCGVAKWLKLPKTQWKSTQPKVHSPIARTSEARQAASLGDKPVELQQLLDSSRGGVGESQKTVLYLGYGSNMSAETFRGKRNIKPVSQVNVVVPELSLTFDLPGIPYAEPCFGNVKYRTTPTTSLYSEKPQPPPHHKDSWRKGLVGIVYEVTQSDYIHIIATEGGGASYQDVLVTCHALPSDPTHPVPEFPTNAPFNAHTLFSPASAPRPDPSYAQPSPRYLKLITDGAAEHDLPYEYQTFLNSIRTYTITSGRQRLGQFIFLSIWGPIFAFFFVGVGKLFLDKDGRYPAWFARFAMATFAACWGSYDDVFMPMFGDGERTEEKGDEETMGSNGLDEKERLVQPDSQYYGATSRSDTAVDLQDDGVPKGRRNPSSRI